MLFTKAIESVLKTYKDAGQPYDLDDPKSYQEIMFRRSGCFAFDWIVGNHSPKGGLPRGTQIEIFGGEGCGKTTLCNVMAASIQSYSKRNGVGYVDFEHKYNIEYAYELGVRKELIDLYRPKGKNPSEAGLQWMSAAQQDARCGLLVLDSLAGMVSKEELAGDLDDANIGARARVQSRGVNQLTDGMNESNASIVYVNQLRDNIGGYGAPDKTPGARAVRFACAVRVAISALAKITDKKGNVIGQKVKMVCKKNQVSRPFLSSEIEMYFGDGYDNAGWVRDKAEDLGVIQKKGSFYYLNEEKFTSTRLTEFLEDVDQQRILYAQCVETNNELMERKKMNRESISKKAASKVVVPLKEEKFLPAEVDLSELPE